MAKANAAEARGTVRGTRDGSAVSPAKAPRATEVLCPRRSAGGGAVSRGRKLAREGWLEKVGWRRLAGGGWLEKVGWRRLAREGWLEEVGWRRFAGEGWLEKVGSGEVEEI